MKIRESSGGLPDCGARPIVVGSAAMGFLRRIFSGSGRIPEDLSRELRAEGVQLLEEGLPVSVTWRHFRSPRRRAGFRRRWFTGAIAVTQKRLVVWARGRHVDVAFADPHFDALEISVEPPDRVLIALDLSAFHDDQSGRFEVRLRSPDAERITGAIRSHARAA